jgi:hypothetical protein
LQIQNDKPSGCLCSLQVGQLRILNSHVVATTSTRSQHTLHFANSIFETGGNRKKCSWLRWLSVEAGEEEETWVQSPASFREHREIRGNASVMDVECHTLGRYLYHPRPTFSNMSNVFTESSTSPARSLRNSTFKFRLKCKHLSFFSCF